MSHEAAVGTATTSTRAAAKAWRTEDWIAVVLGFLVITVVLAAFQWKLVDLRNVVPTFRWTTDSQIASMTPAWINALEQIERDAAPNVVALSGTLRNAMASRDRKAIETAATKMASLGSRSVAGALATEIRGHAAATPERVFSAANLAKVLYLGLAFLIVAAIGIALVGGRVVPFLIGLPVIFALAFAARFLAGNGVFVNFGIEYVIFALLLGLTISNTIGTPEWLKPAVQTEFLRPGL